MEPRTVILITVLGMVLATVVIGLLVLVKRPRTLLWALPLALVGAGAVVSVVAPVILRSNPAGPAASVATVTAPTSVVETSVQPRVPLAQAIAEGRVDVRVAGAGLETIDVTITSRNLTAFEVIIPVGTLFGSPSQTVQNMVARAPVIVALGPAGEEVAASVEAACLNMHRDVPESAHRFSVTGTVDNQDLLQLLKQASFPKQTFRVQQFAIWTITDNPARDEYVGIGYFGFGSGPDEREMEAIRSVLYWAGIQPERYRAFQP